MVVVKGDAVFMCIYDIKDSSDRKEKNSFLSIQLQLYEE